MEPAPRVALIIETSKSFGRGLLEGIGKYVRHHGPWATWVNERSLDDPLPSWLEGWRGDGIIARTRTPEMMRVIANLGPPIVQVGEEYLDSYPMVDIDATANGIAAAEHLMERRFSRYGYVGIRGEGWSKRRERAFVEHVAARGWQCSVLELENGASVGRDLDCGNRIIEDWIASLQRPVGVMVCYDALGCRVIDACRSAGVSIPDEVAVVGVDNDPIICNFTRPSLSSVDQGPDRLGYEAAAMLQRIMEGLPANSPLVLEPVGVKTRLSTDTLALEDKEIAGALTFIRQNAHRGITVADVAEHIAIHRRALERRFRQQLKMTVNDEILASRIRYVKQLLTQTELTVAQVAHTSGFPNPSALSVAFKRETGLTPGRYRRER